MATGKVKWFNNAKGYGFVIAEVGGDDLFVHYSSIQMDGYKTLKAGQAVEFDIEHGPKGRHAVNIRSMEQPVEGDTARDDDGAASDATADVRHRNELAESRG
jgi:CspA family cold shock protein